MTKGDKTFAYSYGADGVRTQKTVDGVTTEYYTVGGKLLAEKTGDRVLTFYYDEKGTPYALELNGTRYYYRYNLQGDVIGLYSTTGAVVAEYTYDPWGKLLSITDTSGTDIGTINPLRYRGYYYDTETGFYFLQSRYYDPTVGRFINADGVVADIADDIRGYNLFAYCFNDPINLSDHTGNWPKWAKLAAVVGASVLAVAAIAAITVATGGTAAPVIVGALLGAVTSGVIDAALQKSFTGQIDFGEVIISASGGAVAGALGGSNGGRVIQATAGAVIGVAQTAAQSFVSGEKATTEEYLLNAATGFVGGLAAGDGVQHRGSPPRGSKKIFRVTDNPAYSMFSKSLASRLATREVVRQFGQGVLHEFVISGTSRTIQMY